MENKVRMKERIYTILWRTNERIYTILWNVSGIKYKKIIILIDILIIL